MNLQPFFTYYGGKYRAAPHYPKPQHDTIIEPFAGSAGYSVRYHEANVILVERNPILVGLWRYIRNASVSDFLRLPDLEPDQTTDDLAVCQEAKWLIGFWLNKGAASPGKRPSAWMRGGLRPHSYWGQTIRERLAAQAGAIRHWLIMEGDYHTAPNVEATWFIDPPYQRAGQHYTASATAISFPLLGAWTQMRSGQVIACENAGADWLPFEPFKTIKATHGKRLGTSEEVLWYREETEVREQAA